MTPPIPKCSRSSRRSTRPCSGCASTPRHAELAELALLLADERPRVTPEFAQELDARVARRFGPAPPLRSGRRRAAAAPRGRSMLRTGSVFGAGFAAAAAVAVGVIVIADNNGSPVVDNVRDAERRAGASTPATARHAARTVTLAARVGGDHDHRRYVVWVRRRVVRRGQLQRHPATAASRPRARPRMRPRRRLAARRVRPHDLGDRIAGRPSATAARPSSPPSSS